MAGASDFELPVPKSEYLFEHMILDIYALEWHDPDLNGRRGQEQHGVDVYGYPGGHGTPPTGVQCKRYYNTKLTDEDVLKELAKAENFRPTLGRYIIATTMSRDAKLQEFVRLTNDARVQAGKFPVSIMFWEDICKKLNDPGNKELLKRFMDTHYTGIRDLYIHTPVNTVAPAGKQGDQETGDYIRETVFSTLLPIERLPAHVYGAPSDLKTDSAVRELVSWPPQEELAPFILRGGKLFTFQDLTKASNPFRHVVPAKSAERYSVGDWLSNPDHLGWYINLLNKSITRFMTVRGLTFDPKHKRFYFRQLKPGEEIPVEYKPLNQSVTSRMVVWQPKNKKTGLPRGDWYHRAVSLRFNWLGDEGWCLSVRPELHITVDGVQPPPPQTIGAKVTRKKSRTFNYDLLAEVQFWRDYLSGSKPHIILRFGGQSLVIRTNLAEGSISWPGIPEEHAKPFKNVYYVDDLWSWAERNELDEEVGDDDDEAGEPEDWGLDDGDF
ncbi:MAG: hypothetical protein IVW55_03975 [Chloroflexi bacterium]|nr:hypothetical protein [Chloroflexota bacterium]